MRTGRRREQIGDRFRSRRNARSTSRASVGFARGGRLQEGAGRQRHLGAAHRHASARRAAPPVRRGASAARGDASRRPRASAAVRSRPSAAPSRARRRRARLRSRSTWMSSGLRVGASASAIAQAAGIAPSSAGRQHRAAVDRHDVMRAQRREADLEHVVGAAPGMKHRAPAALAMRIDQVVDRRARARPARSASITRPRFQSR